MKAIFVSAPDSMAIVFPMTHEFSGGAGVVGHVTSPLIGAHGAHMSDNATSAQAEIATRLDSHS